MKLEMPKVTIDATPDAAVDLAEDLDEVLLAAGSRVSPDAGKRLARLSEKLSEKARGDVVGH